MNNFFLQIIRMSEKALKQQIQNLKKHNARLARLARDARSKLSAALDRSVFMAARRSDREADYL